MKAAYTCKNQNNIPAQKKHCIGLKIAFKITNVDNFTYDTFFIHPSYFTFLDTNEVQVIKQKMEKCFTDL